MKKIFFLHPHKCGGSSIRKALKASSIKNQLLADCDVDTVLSESDASIFCGHAHQLGCRHRITHEYFIKSINYLYFNCFLVMPVRHPANILQSWMHYHCKTFNEALEKNTVMKMKPEKLSRLASLKQSSLSMDNNKVYITGDKMVLNQEDEEDNLLEFASHDLSRRHSIFRAVTRSMEWELFFPYRKILDDKYLKGLPVEINPPSPPMNDIHYFDIECIRSETYSFFEKHIGEDFVEVLKDTCVNKSTPQATVRARCMPRVVNYLLKNTPNEFKIFEMAYS